MTTIVLYADDMEAITVIDLPWSRSQLDGLLQDRRQIRVPVPTRTSFSPQVGPEHDQPTFSRPRNVTIWTERFHRNGNTHWFFFTRDEEAALLLRSAPLPGQRKELQEEFRLGFAEGLLAAIAG